MTRLYGPGSRTASSSFRLLAVPIETRSCNLGAAGFAGQRIQPVGARSAEVLFDDPARIAVMQLLTLQNPARIDFVFGLARHELHGQKEFQRREIHVVACDPRFTARLDGLANRIPKERREMEASIDQIDAETADVVAHTDTADTKRSNFSGRPSQRLGGVLGGADRHGEIRILRGSGNAPRVESQPADEREVGALSLERRRRGRD